MILTLFILAFVVLIVAVSFALSKYMKSGEDFYLAGRRMPWWIIGPTTAAGLFGGTSMLVVAGNAMTDGLSAIWLLTIPSWVGALVSTLLFAKRVRQLPGIISLPDIIGLRYDKNSKTIFSIVIVCFYIAWTTSQILAIGTFIHGFIGVPTMMGMIIALIIVVIYSTAGGFLGVTITDSIMCIILTIGLFILAGYGFNWAGSWNNIVAEVTMTNPDYFHWFSESINPLLAIAYIGAFGLALVPQQDIFQRYASAKNERNAVLGGYFALIILIPIYILPIIFGFSGNVWLPLDIAETVPADEFLAWASKNMFNPYISAFLFVAVIAAIMSTLSTAINSGALSLTKDIYQRFINKEASPKRIVHVSRLSTILMGVIALLFATTFDFILDALMLAFSVAFTGMFIPIVGAFYWKRATARGATWSSLSGAGFIIIDFILDKVGLAIPWSDSAYSLIVAASLSLITFVVGSMTSKKPTQEQLKHFIPKQKDSKNVEAEHII